VTAALTRSSTLKLRFIFEGFIPKSCICNKNLSVLIGPIISVRGSNPHQQLS